MFKKTAIVFGLAIVTGSAFAAGSGMNGSNSGSLTARFHQLDTNNDGVLSSSEARADPKVAKLYSSMDTGASIKTDPRAKKGDQDGGGITLNQFQAGMQAANGGSAGPAVSGGQRYTVMKDGSKRMMSNSTQDAGNDMNRTQQRMQSAGQSMNNKASQMNQSAQDGASGMQNRASQMRSNAQSQADHMRSNAASGAQSQNAAGQNAGDTGGVRANDSVASPNTSNTTGDGNKPY